MSLRAPVALRPTRADLAVAKAAAGMASRTEERMLKTTTVLADEKVVLAATALFWIRAHWGRCGRERVRAADHMLLCVAVSSALSHVLKHLFRRRRPDRTVVHRHRHGIPRSGNAWDSFPSGHAMNLGALAGSIARLAPKTFRPLVWPAMAALAASRILLLAHYPTDVVAGFFLGLSLDKILVKASGYQPRHSLMR
jgi:membrane-associated phospholipid phosphatase